MTIPERPAQGKASIHKKEKDREAAPGPKSR